MDYSPDIVQCGALPAGEGTRIVVGLLSTDVPALWGASVALPEVSTLAAPEVYAFALLTAVLWGLTGVVMKLGLERDGTSMLATVVVVVVSFSLFLAASTIAYGVGDFYREIPPAAIGLFLLAGVIGGAFGRLASFVGVDRVGASVNTAVLNSRPVFAVVLAVVFLHEPLTGQLALGVVVITAGVVVLSLSRGGDIRGWRVRDLAFPGLGALAYAVGNILRRAGFLTAEVNPVSAIVLNEFGGLLVIGAYLAHRRGAELFVASRRTYGYFVLGGLASGGGLLSLFYALSLGPVVVVDPLAATPPLFAILFSYLLLGGIERITRRLIAGAMLVVIGIALVTLA